MPRPKGRTNRPFPTVRLEFASEVAQAIKENNAGRPMNRLLLAEAMKYSPGSSGFRDRIASSAKYELTAGNYHSDVISLTALGVSVTRPRNDQERVEAQRQAFRAIPIFGSLLEHFANSKLPEADFLKNILERGPFDIDPAWSLGLAEAFREDAAFVGYLRPIGGSTHIVLDSSTAAPEAPPADAAVEAPSAGIEQIEQAREENVPGVANPVDGEQRSPSTLEQPEGAARRAVPMQIFIAHGKKRKPLEELKRILNDWKVPYLVAVDEPNAGRPISKKVADTMRMCSAGIFIFTADEEFLDEDSETVGRPSENVVYELGAASLLYGRKIVILKEVGVTFPSDFGDLGWIEFGEDALDAKALDLLRELIALEALRLVSPATM